MKLYAFLFLLTHSISLYPACVAGGLQQITGSPFAVGGGPTSVAFSPVINGNLFAAVTNFDDNAFSVFFVNQTTGLFSPVNGSPFGGVNGPNTIAFSPIVSGNLFAAITNAGTNTVSVFSVNTSTGAFNNTVPGSPFATGTNPFGVAFSPVFNGNLFAAVTNAIDNTVSLYLVDQVTGEFTQIGSPFPSGSAPVSIAFSPIINGNLFAAAANAADNTVSLYSVNQNTGLVPVLGSPFPTGINPEGVVFSPVFSGKTFFATTDFDANTVTVYSINQSGQVAAVSGSPFQTGSEPQGIALSPIVAGNLYATITNANDNTVSVYLVNQSTGVFSPISTSPFPTGFDPVAAAYSPLLSSNNLFVAVVNGADNTVSVYKVCSSGNVNVTAVTIKNIFLVQTELVNVIKWQAPSGFTPVSYNVYRDPSFTQLAGQVSASRTQFLDHNIRPGVTYTYFIVAVDASGNQVLIGSISITP